LQTVRDYAYERLSQNAEELHQVQLALVTYVEDVVARACAVPPTQRTPAWLDAIALEHDAIRAALQWALAEANAIERGAALVVGLTYFWQARRQRDGARWFELALDLADRLQPALRASVLLEYVTIRPDSRRTIASVEAAVEAYRRIPDLRGLRAALGRLGQTLINTGRFGEAERALTECLALDESARDPTVTARATVLLGAARLYGGDGQGARALFERGFALAAETDDAANVACAHYGLGETALTEGDVEVAFLHARAAIDLFSMLGDYRCIGWSRSLLAYAYLRRDALEEALTEALAAMRELRDAQYSLPFVEALLVASGALGRRGEPERAAHALAYAEGMRAVLHPFGLGQPWATLDDEARAAIAAIDVDVALTRKAGERGDVAVVFDVLEGR
jgi:tetratricopeptide (TPR) repeat protein